MGRKYVENCRQKISVHAAKVMGAETGKNLQPIRRCKAMPTPVGVWWAFAKNLKSDTLNL
jgi:hypothetical protein